MLHIDDWLDDPTTGPADVKEWLEHFRRPAIETDHAWLRARQLFCTYKDGKRYRCIGCSRMGDVWLTEHFERENGYDLRIDIADCTGWEVVSNVEGDRRCAASSRSVQRPKGARSTDGLGVLRSITVGPATGKTESMFARPQHSIDWQARREPAQEEKVLHQGEFHRLHRRAFVEGDD